MNNKNNEQQKISMTYQDSQGRKTLDLPRLADAFRRTAGRVFEEQEMAAVFNRKAVKLSMALIDFEQGHEGRTNRKIKKAMEHIAIMARDLDIERIILPVDESRVSGKHLRDNIMYGENFAKFYNVQVDFQNTPYESTAEIGNLGQPEKNYVAVTAFDYGLFN